MNRAERRKAGVKGKPAHHTAASGSLEQHMLQQALQMHQQNRLVEAEGFYRQVLAINPRQPDALHLLGVLASQVGQAAMAEQLILQAIEIDSKNIDMYLNLARVYDTQQRHADIVQLLNRALKADAEHPQLHFHLGVACGILGKHEESIAHFKRSIARNPTALEAYWQLAMVLKSTQRLREAVDTFMQALKHHPNHFGLLHELANCLDADNRQSEADPYFEKAYALAQTMPPSAATCTLMGSICARHARYEEAVSHHRKALEYAPNDAMMLSNLAGALRKSGALVQAEEYYQRAIAANPNIWGIHFNLACLYQEQVALDAAIESGLKALALNPNSPQILAHLGAVYTEKSAYEEGERYLKRALALAPKDAHALIALGYLENSKGNITGAMEYYAQAFLQPEGHPTAHSNYLFTMHYAPGVKPEDIHAESIRWATRYADHLPRLSLTNDADPERKLRIGYVSADFHDHPSTAYLEPVLKHHDKTQFEIFCYANQAKRDTTTDRLTSCADHWHNILTLTDTRLAERIQQDKIDILIDLSGHTAGNRLLAFAQKPAPIQATWIGYFNTTGMQAMDYIITDRFLLPPEEEALYSETPLRLPHCGAPFTARHLPVALNALPAASKGYVTFGCFNALPKLTPQVLKVWGALLQRMPSARLLLKNKGFGNEETCAQYRKLLIDAGATEQQIEFSGYSAPEQYLQAYHDVDIALDPFPYNGSTTTLDAFWMGVPVIALKGQHLVSHIGETLLNGVGLGELVAQDTQAYIDKAAVLANDLPRLKDIRSSLRQTLADAPITNHALFTRDLETALRTAWRTWCQHSAK